MTPTAARLSATADVLAAVALAPDGLRSFTHETLAALTRHVGSDLTTLSVCDVRTARRRVVSEPAAALHPDDIAAFDRLFHSHPLVRFHAGHPGAGSHRICDSLTTTEFRASALYADYYRRIGIRHAVAVPLHVDGDRIVSFVLNRGSREFSGDDVRALDFLRGPLAALYRQVIALRRLRGALVRSAANDTAAEAVLTPREREIVHWVAAGKTDAQIALLVSTSVRTVQKHLQNAYVKLGVETRTAAAMRVVGPRPVRPMASRPSGGTRPNPTGV